MTDPTESNLTEPLALRDSTAREVSCPFQAETCSSAGNRAHEGRQLRGPGAGCWRFLGARSGSVLVAALIVLLIVGMLTAQTMQAMMLVGRGDVQNDNIRQAHELLELGTIWLLEQDSALPTRPLDVEVFPASETEPAIFGRLRFELLDGASRTDASADEEKLRIRIVAEFPREDPQQAVASKVVMHP